MPLLGKLKNLAMLHAFSVRVNILSAVVFYLRKKFQPNGLSSPLKIGCFSLLASMVAGSPSYKKLTLLLPALRLKICSSTDVIPALVMCDFCCTHSKVSKTKEWPFEPDIEVLFSIRLKGSS